MDDILHGLATYLSYAFSLKELPNNAATIVKSFAFFTAVHLVVGPALSSWLSPATFGKMNKRQRNQWSNRVVALVHAIIIVPLAARCASNPVLERDRAFGWDDPSGTVIAIASGYFLWDTLECLIHFVDVGFVIHALACFTIYTLEFRPFLAYFGTRCLMWELSTPFLNVHWFLDKTGQTGTKLQLVNGVLLLSTFAGARLIWGTIVSWRFFETLYTVRGQVPVGYLLVYGIGNVVLNLLNWFWFTKMIAALGRRFTSSGGAKPT
ncbi:DUF887-domain-containing protein [Punctularia strigosozonata HHB-11173 SS5]|uniref:DUF887-domain-containing protein n=1 Tax=Punctularia strigosozonata (strain HHB-11173) TaxID=741275 RepID=UPI00044172AA|nr:DUF887-domain-containing protein [Punctularia strigosozonata HHB-11173 SS5]EIN07188.1 DUF887-domain-containing protein [Punctularia strigosozonata HHB-11173 SS5]